MRCDAGGGVEEVLQDTLAFPFLFPSSEPTDCRFYESLSSYER